MKVVPPGGHRSWLEMLPEEYRDNPDVLVVMVPEGTRGTLERTPDGAHVGVLVTPRGTKRMLQCVDPPLVGWMEHSDVAERHGYTMASPDYIGPMESIPRRYLINAVRFPLILQRDRLWAAPLNLRNHARSLTRKEDDNN